MRNDRGFLQAAHLAGGAPNCGLGRLGGLAARKKSAGRALAALGPGSAKTAIASILLRDYTITARKE